MLKRNAFALLLLVAACRSGTPEVPPVSPQASEADRLPTGRWLDPAVPSMDLGGSLPLSAVLHPDGRRLAVLLSGFGRQGIEIVSLPERRVIQTLEQPAAFVGLALTPDGRTLYASGGNQDVVYRYDWDSAGATLRDSLLLGAGGSGMTGMRYPAGLGLSPDGRFLYVAENLADSLAVVETATGRVLARYPVERYPYGVAVAGDGTVYASAWGGRTVSVFEPTPDGSRARRGPGPTGWLWPLAPRARPAPVRDEASGARRECR